jgi:hypothetical protein
LVALRDGAAPARADSDAARDAIVRAVASRLSDEFKQRDGQEVEQRVRSEFARYREARLTQFVPVFVERNIRDEFRGRR